MRWFRPANGTLAQRVPEGALRRFLTASPPAGGVPLSELRLLAVDFETTGLDPARDLLLAAGMVAVDGLSIPLGSLENRLVRPAGPVGGSATIHRLTDDRLAVEGRPLAEVVDRVLDRLTGRVLLTHHAGVEVAFLTAAVRQVHGVTIQIPAVVDTLRLGQRALGAGDHAPDALRLWRLRRRSGLPSYRGHDAVVDALACAELYLALVAELTAARYSQVRC